MHTSLANSYARSTRGRRLILCVPLATGSMTNDVVSRLCTRCSCSIAYTVWDEEVKIGDVARLAAGPM
jgi:hypothetical protein